MPLRSSLSLLRARLRRFAQLAPAERRFLVFAWAALPLAWLTVRRHGWAGARDRLVRPARRGRGAGIAPQRAAELVNIASRHSWPPDNCLARTLLLARHLSALGLPYRVCMGSHSEDGVLKGHAWVEYADEPLGEPVPPERRYQLWHAASAGPAGAVSGAVPGAGPTP